MFRDLPKAGSGPAEKQPKAENAYDMAEKTAHYRQA